jgi:hypothetical protein
MNQKHLLRFLFKKKQISTYILIEKGVLLLTQYVFRFIKKTLKTDGDVPVCKVYTIISQLKITIARDCCTRKNFVIYFLLGEEYDAKYSIVL